MLQKGEIWERGFPIPKSSLKMFVLIFYNEYTDYHNNYTYDFLEDNKLLPSIS